MIPSGDRYRAGVGQLWQTVNPDLRMGPPSLGGRLALAVWVSGGALLALELGVRPARFWEWSSAAVLVKLLLVGWMALDEAPRLLLFWVLVAWSVVFAHAPASVRHRRWRGVDS